MSSSPRPIPIGCSIDRDAAIGREGSPARSMLDNELIRPTKAWKTGRVVYLNNYNWYLLGSAGSCHAAERGRGRPRAGGEVGHGREQGVLRMQVKPAGGWALAVLLGLLLVLCAASVSLGAGQLSFDRCAAAPRPSAPGACCWSAGCRARWRCCWPA